MFKIFVIAGFWYCEAFDVPLGLILADLVPKRVPQENHFETQNRQRRRNDPTGKIGRPLLKSPIDNTIGPINHQVIIFHPAKTQETATNYSLATFYQ